MRQLVSIILFLLIASAPAAEQWRSDRYRCELTYPENESWVQGTPMSMQSGEMIYIASNAASKQSVCVLVIPNVPNSDVENAAVVSRIMDPVVALGFQISGHSPVTQNGQKFLHIVGHREESAGSKLVCAARAALRQNTLFIALTYGAGDETLAADKKFVHVIETFKLLDEEAEAAPPAVVSMSAQYHQAYLVCFGAAAALLVIGAGALLFSRPKR